MAVNIGPKIGIDGEAEYRKQLNNIIQQAKTLDSEMKAVTSAFGKNENSQESLAAQSRVLAQQIQVQQQRITQLEKGLDASAKKYGETANETLKWKQAVNEAKASLNKMESQLDGLGNAVDDVADSMDGAEKSTFGFGDALKANLAAGAIIEGIKSITGALSDMVEETKEFRKIMGSLEISSEKAGYTAEETAEHYRTLYGVLADDQTAATTTANLQALGLAQEDLNRLINGTIGAWATYGDSIPIDGLAEAINETVKTGTVTGTFADVLNWAGTSEDGFNEKLQAAATTAERANIVLQELASQGLISAGQGWQENNKSLVESNKATADFQTNMAELSQRIEPVTTAIREGLNIILSKALELTENVDFSGIAQSLADGFSGFVETVVPKVLEFGNFLINNKDTIIAAVAGIGAGFAAWKIGSIISTVVTAISGFVGQVNTANFSFKALNATMKANIFIAIASAIASLIGYLITLWNTNEDFRNAVIAAWEAIKGVFDAVWGAIVGFFTKTIPEAWNSVVEWVQGIPEWWAGIWEQVGQFFENVWNSIVSFFTETIPAWIQSVIDWFNSLPEKIGNAIGQVLGHIIQFGVDAWNWVTVELPKIFAQIFVWFSELPGKIWDWLKEAVGKIIQWGLEIKQKAEDAVVGMFNSIVNWFKELPGNIWNWLKQVVSDIARWGLEMKQKAESAVKNVIESVINWFKELPGKIVEIGKNIITGLWDGITSMVSWIGDKISGFFGGIVDGVKGVLGIHSPSKVFAEIGEFTGEGFEKGLSSSMNAALKYAKKEMQTGIDGLNAAVSVSGTSAKGAPATPTENYAGVTINVYAAAGQDEKIIAERVARELRSEVIRKEKVFA